jgi:type II secretory ATPase GspE/PulE/Tfp pilus assembly ATPase PilB-like protein
MAQRLVRKSCQNCGDYRDFTQEKEYTFAKETLMKMNKEILATELKKRGVDQIHWQNFLQGKIRVGT